MSAILARLAYTLNSPGMHYHGNQKKVVFFVFGFFFQIVVLVFHRPGALGH